MKFRLPSSLFNLCVFLAVVSTAETRAATADAEHGMYVLTAAGCIGCHTTKEDFKKGVLMSGGRALKTPFGVFYSPNITPDSAHGIGSWTEANFIEALRNGISPDGSHYLPVFPYTSFTKMTDDDMRDLWAYLKTTPAVAVPNKSHTAPFIFRMRFTIGPWKLLNFEPGAFQEDKDKSPEWNRGAYITNALAHCGECHTPRNLMGGLKQSMYLAGTKDGPEGEAVPNITPDKETGIGQWSDDDLDTMMTMGMLPDGDFVGSGMAEVVENLAKLTVKDREALLIYLTSVHPIKNSLK